MKLNLDRISNEMAKSSHKTFTKSITEPALSQKDAKPISKNKTIISKTFIFVFKWADR